MGLKHLILYEDNHLLIVNKPSGWLSQGDQTGDKSILDIFKDYLKTRDRKEGNVFLGLPHRLDRPVSGCIILCKTSKSLTRMTQLIKDRKLKKIYHAVIKDRVYREPATLKSFIKKDTRRNRAIISDKEFKFSKSAILHFEVLQIIDKFSLLEIELETGRPHQIRAQLAHHKMPIHGDSKYSGKKPLKDKSIALHARKVGFEHPVSGEMIQVVAPYEKKPWWDKFESN